MDDWCVKPVTPQSLKRALMRVPRAAQEQKVTGHGDVSMIGDSSQLFAASGASGSFAFSFINS